MKDYIITLSLLMAEWNYAKNINLDPSKLTIGSSKKAWWICDKGHEWESPIKSRAIDKTKCPICQNRIVLENYNDLCTTHPHLADEWNYKKNININPKNITSGSNKKVWWICDKGHEWEDKVNNRRQGSKCPYCLLSKATHDNNLTVLRPDLVLDWDYSQNTINPTEITPISGKQVFWLCHTCGHKWSTSVAYRNRGHGCPQCYNNRRGATLIKYTVDMLNSTLKEKGGTCLTKLEKFTTKTKLSIKCNCGHIWDTTYSLILQGSWCPSCAGSLKKTLDDVIALAQSKGGKCLSTEYINSLSPLNFVCSNGHHFTSSYSNIRLRWCPICSGKQKKTIEFAKELAEQRNGKCLSEEYIGNKDKLKWQCSLGHTWYASLNSVSSKRTWCPTCSDFTLLNESKCRYILEKIFGEPFTKTRTVFDSNLELDGYCKKYSVAFEFNGIQHYEYTPIFHKTIDHFFNQQKRDETKKLLCEQAGIFLITIPFTETSISDNHLINYILELLSKKIDINSLNTDIDLSEFYLENTPLSDFKNIAIKRGGECLSTEYNGPKSKLKFKCSEGHIWYASPSDIKNSNSWCPYCGQLSSAKKRAFGIEYVKEFISKYNGDCLSDKYLNSHSKLSFKCSEGHIFSIDFHSIKNKGKWCPVCQNRPRVSKLTLEELQENANSKGGKCLSSEYINSTKKLEWECEQGHTFKMSANSVRSGQWCPECAKVNVANSHKLDIDSMQKLAASKGGLCLSSQYINNKTKLEWMCKSKHIFTMAPTSVKSGQWCPECAKEKLKELGKLKRLGIETAQSLAKEHDCTCISTNYTNSTSPLEWQCNKCGTIWSNNYNNMKARKHWCKCIDTLHPEE